MQNKPPPLFKHQKQTKVKLKAQPRFFDQSEPGCVSADTEFLTPTGWKRIDKYVYGDKVAQFQPNTRHIEFIEPIKYIKIPCKQMIAIAPTRGTSQRLSAEHRVLYYMPDGTHGVMSAVEYMHKLHTETPARFHAKFCTTFSVKNESNLNFSDAQLRVMVAVIADGHFPPYNTDTCIVRLKKSRKVARLTGLLNLADIPYVKRKCGGQPDFTVFRFTAPMRAKVFDSYWWGASQHQLEIIADEARHWDSSESKRPSRGTRFSTIEEQSADFMQYAFSAAKRPSSIACMVRDRTSQGRGVSVEYNVQARAKDALIGPGRPDSVYLVSNKEGFKYCFEVPSTFLLLRHNGYIFATGNTGKTRVQIEDFAERRAKGGKPAIITATRSTLESAWADDFAKYAPDVKVAVAYAHNREKAFASDADVIITNHDAVNWLAKQGKPFWKRFEGGTLINDESTAFKHATSQRSKNMVKIAEHFEHRRNMCGLADPNGVLDLWHQYFILDEGKRLGKSFFAFRNAVCQPEQVGPMSNMVKWVEKPGIANIVAALVKDITIKHLFSECVDIPANHEYTRPIALGTKHAKHYAEMQNDMVTTLKTQVISAVNKAVLRIKLLQIASGAIYNSDESGYSRFDTDRYEFVLDLVQECAHSVVFFQWEHQRDELVKEAEKRGVRYAVFDGKTKDKKRAAITEDYQKGMYDVIFAHPKSAAHGLTWTKGTRTIWASPTDNLEWFVQGLKRIYRIGQTEKTETITVVARGTYDEIAYERLTGKALRSDEFTAMLKKYIT